MRCNHFDGAPPCAKRVTVGAYSLPAPADFELSKNDLASEETNDIGQTKDNGCPVGRTPGNHDIAAKRPKPQNRPEPRTIGPGIGYFQRIRMWYMVQLAR